MKALLRVVTFATTTILSTAHVFGASMQLEGSCHGTLADSTQVAFTYYSDFDGCKNESKAAVTFTEGDFSSGLFTGKRYFKADKDIYSFTVKDGNKEVEKVRLEFEDSTGNLSGILKTENSEAVTVSCEIRDYSYAEC